MSKRVEIKLVDPSDRDIIDFLDTDKRKNSDIIRDAIRFYIANTEKTNDDERLKRLMREVLAEHNLQAVKQNATPVNSKLGSTGFSPKKL